MTMRTHPDVLVVGGGLVGLASAVALGERGARVLLCEAEPGVARHQSGHNSGVVHAGLYYAPGSRRAALCRSGREALYAFCEAEGVPHRRTGKLVVATDEAELPRLDELERRGQANGLVGLERLGPGDITALEPAARGVAGLLVQETGLVDYPSVARALVRRLEAAGGEVRTGARVVSAERWGGDSWRVRTTAGAVEAPAVLTCAGLQADRVARRFGAVVPVRVVPFRGEYCLAPAALSGLVRRPIYPVPDPAFPFLGVHVTPTVDGRLEAGPNAVLALAREGYRPGALSPRDVADFAGWPGFWRFGLRHWRRGLSERARAHDPASFARAVGRLVPALGQATLGPGPTGVRAIALGRDGRLVDDFLVLEQDGAVHCLNAPSPAATACLAIGADLADRVCRMVSEKCAPVPAESVALMGGVA